MGRREYRQSSSSRECSRRQNLSKQGRTSQYRADMQCLPAHRRVMRTQVCQAARHVESLLWDLLVVVVVMLVVMVWQQQLLSMMLLWTHQGWVSGHAARLPHQGG